MAAKTTKTARKIVSMPEVARKIYAKYDAAQTTPENKRHWGASDSLSPSGAMTTAVRKTLRNRSRYEVANNSYAMGIVLTLANDCVGTGPKLQFHGTDDAQEDAVEGAFQSWAKEIKLARKLRTMRKARARDGEAFGFLLRDESLRSPVKLNLQLIECDRVTSPYIVESNYERDGIVYDKNMNPLRYLISDSHPGDNVWQVETSYTSMPANQVLHWFRCDRAEQLRGIPELTPAMELFAELRRYTKAVRMAAEVAAELNLYLKTSFVPEEADALGDAWTEIDVVRNAAMVLPEGWEMQQMRSEQPAQSHAEFVRTVISEIARCLNMPYAVAAGDSSSHNFASGRLDHQVYHKSLDVERDEIEDDVLNPLFSTWVEMASVVPGLRDIQNTGFDYEWFWQKREHVDPAKESNAQRTRLETGTTTLAYELSRSGLDWLSVVRQRAKEERAIRDARRAEGLEDEDEGTENEKN